MALDKAGLKNGIKNLLQNTAENEGSYDDFATGLSNLIDAFVKTGKVTVSSGIPVKTEGTAASQVGKTIADGTGTIS